jgi:insertion element IS1 protein InsB
MECRYCMGGCKKDGRQPNGKQKYRCKQCGKCQQAEYSYNACKKTTEEEIVSHVKEGCGINNIARLLDISKVTVIAKIKRIAKGIEPITAMPSGCCYEMDELHTFVGCKRLDCYVSYAICKDTRNVVDFVVGPRTKLNLEKLTKKLMGFSPSRIYTDGLNLYPPLLPREVHRVGKSGTLRIERKNLTLRINLKRLARRTICFSRSIVMLEACLRIWFWG